MSGPNVLLADWRVPRSDVPTQRSHSRPLHVTFPDSGSCVSPRPSDPQFSNGRSCSPTERPSDLRHCPLILLNPTSVCRRIAARPTASLLHRGQLDWPAVDVIRPGGSAALLAVSLRVLPLTGASRVHVIEPDLFSRLHHHVAPWIGQDRWQVGRRPCPRIRQHVRHRVEASPMASWCVPSSDISVRVITYVMVSGRRDGPELVL